MPMPKNAEVHRAASPLPSIQALSSPVVRSVHPAANPFVSPTPIAGLAVAAGQIAAYSASVNRLKSIGEKA
jgi:hypothetical protein